MNSFLLLSLYIPYIDISAGMKAGGQLFNEDENAGKDCHYPLHPCALFVLFFVLLPLLLKNVTVTLVLKESQEVHDFTLCLLETWIMNRADCDNDAEAKDLQFDGF